MQKTILVTGGSGFISSYILRLLAERGDTVVNLDVREPGPEAAWLLKDYLPSIHFVQGGVDNWAAIVTAIEKYRPTAIIHTAAVTNPVLLSRQPSLALKVMVEGTYNVLEAARIFGIGRVVYLSSIGVLPAVQYQPIDVNHPVLLATEGPGSSFYGAAKVGAEAFCWAYHQSFGLDFITIRPSAVYGFGMQWPLFVKPMVENSVQGLPTHFERGREFPRDYTHAADVAQLAVNAADIPADQVRDRVFYGATGRPLVTAGQVADVVKELIPGAAIEIGSGLSENDLLEIRYRGILSIQNAQEQLGYTPQFGDIRDGVANYIEMYRRYRAG